MNRFGKIGMWLWLSVLLGVIGANAADTPASKICVVCSQTITGGTVWRHAQGLICDRCVKLERRCWICGIPMLTGETKTSDGRLICKLDAAQAILTTTEAERVFEETRAEVDRLTGGMVALKQPRVAVTLYDVDYWNQAADGKVPQDQRRFGVSHSRQTGRDWSHSVLLYGGLPRLRLMGTCAHELTHLWINENLAEHRVLDADTTEAICELMAYKLMALKQCPEEQERIRRNTYTHGKIDELLELDQSHGLLAILDWVLSGTGAVIDAAQLSAPRNPAYRVWGTLTERKEWPDSLRLRGVSGPVGKRMALINDRYFLKGDEKEVALKDKPTLVRCVDVLDDAVVVQMDGHTNQITLRMGN
jgi:hypothetical protein